MKTWSLTPLEVALQLFGDAHEIPGDQDNPLILAALQAVELWPQHDEVPWCSAMVHLVCKAMGLPRPHRLGLRARSWLTVGTPMPLKEAMPGWDVVVFKRGADPQPGTDVVDAPGHVGFFLAAVGSQVLVFGGNQHNSASHALFPVSDLLQVRRL